MGILTWESMSPNPLLVPDPSGGRDIAIFLNAEVPSPARPTTPPLGRTHYLHLLLLLGGGDGEIFYITGDIVRKIFRFIILEVKY